MITFTPTGIRYLALQLEMSFNPVHTWSKEAAIPQAANPNRVRKKVKSIVGLIWNEMQSLVGSLPTFWLASSCDYYTKARCGWFVILLPHGPFIKSNIALVSASWAL